MKKIEPCVYILASKYNGTLYVGVTSCLYDRMICHREGVFKGFTRKHVVHHLVYYECHEDMEDAIKREKRLKKWNRLWKIKLIEQMNPGWQDLFDPVGGIVVVGVGGQKLNSLR